MLLGRPLAAQAPIPARVVRISAPVQDSILHSSAVPQPTADELIGSYNPGL